MAETVGYMRAKDALSGKIKGEPVFVSKGELVHPDHPIVKAYPDNFEPGQARLDAPEQATNAPGEKRGTRKATKRSPASSSATVEHRGLRSEDLHRKAE